jgi:hypothetical protein
MLPEYVRRGRYLPGMDDPATDPSQLLASDAERDHSVLVLRDAVAEGRLTLEEFGERVGGAQTARTHGELARLTADLPQRPLPVPAGASEPVRYNAVCSHITRSGAWELPSRSHWRAICGTVDIDLREVRLHDAEIELQVFNLFGTVTVLVPPGIAVEVDGGGLFASQIIDPPPFPPPAGAPRVRIRASGPGGTLYVRSVGPRE